MAELVLCIAGVAAILYAVLAGADFGVGMIEPWLGPEGEAHVDRALLPVWEANHVWLVLLVVVGFVAFPVPFSLLAVDLHIPLVLMLLGVVARGSAFTFRHYDPERERLARWYTWTFRFGSLLAPLFLGVIAAASVEGRLPRVPTGSFYASFVQPWNTLFAWGTGLFTCALFAFEGTALLAAELGTSAHAPLPYLRLARRLHLVSMLLGALLLVLAWRSDAPALRAALRTPLSLACQLAALLATPLIAWAFARGRPWLLRVATGAQLSCVLIGLWGPMYPVLIAFEGGSYRIDVAAPASTLRALLIALGVGLTLIVPSLLYLFRVYKLGPAGSPEPK